MYERLQAGGLRAWYDALPHADDPGLGEWIARGKVVGDRRLADYLREADGRLFSVDTDPTNVDLGYLHALRK
jgi:hypothetical protein